MNPFSIFVIFYVTAFLMEILEKWQDLVLSWTAIGMVILLIFPRITRLKFLIFLLLTTAYFLIFLFPDVANHVNLIIYLNIALIVGGIYSYFIIGDHAVPAYADRDSDLPSAARDLSRQNSEYFEIVLPILRSALIIVYFLAGFHKLNRDFFNPQVSCSKIFFLNIIAEIKTEFLGLPLLFWLIVVFLISGWYLLSKKLAIFHNNKLLKLGLLATIIPLAWTILFLLETHANFLASLFPLIYLLTPVVVVIWEILGGLLLSVAKLQLPILLFSLMMHLIFVLIDFTAFGALALALLLTFIPQSYYQLLLNNLYINIFKIKVNRVYLYFWLNALGGLVEGINHRIHSIPNFRTIIEFLFYLSVIIFIYPLISVIFLPVAKRPIWTGVSIFNSKMPKFMWLFPLFLLTFGFSSYLGLGTAGNFSMFSNLKTEGMTSNHLLLSQNPFKIFKYQEDTVKIYVAFSEKNNQKFYLTLNNRPFAGNSLPLVEFKKSIYNWTKNNEKVSMMFKYQDKAYPTRDIINDPIWKTPKQNWEMKLLNFRLISSVEPNECSW